MVTNAIMEEWTEGDLDYDEWLEKRKKLYPNAKLYNYVGCHEILAENELTEQYCEGKLPEGWYYVKTMDMPDFYIYPCFYATEEYKEEGTDEVFGFFNGADWRGVVQILGKVPTWKEAQELEKIKKMHNDKKSA